MGKQKSKKRQPCKTGKDEEEKTSCKKQPPVLNSSVPEDPGHGAFKDDRLSHQDEMVKNMAQNAVKEKVSSNIQSNDKKLGNTELQCLSKSKNNPNLCANIPFKESNQVNQGKRDCIIPVEDNEGEMQVIQYNIVSESHVI